MAKNTCSLNNSLKKPLICDRLIQRKSWKVVENLLFSCEVDSSYTQKSGEFYQEYHAYCLKNGEYARSTTDFYTGLEVAGFGKQKTEQGAMIYGI